MSKVPSILEWILRNKITNERGDLIEFDKHLFMLEPYSNWHPKQCSMKSAQVGFSTMAILKALYALGYLKKNIIYTLPNFDDVEDFVPSKVNVMIRQNQAIRDLIGDSDAVKQKQVGGNTIWFRGTHKEKAAIMHSSDLNMYDELDVSNQNVIETYSSRLQYSDYKGEWAFSNPTIPNFGVSDRYADSDQRKWVIQCSRCKTYQDLRWPRNVDYKLREFICHHCKKPLSYDDRREGQWVAAKPGHEVHGYHISQLMCPWVTAHELLKLEEKKPAAMFHNMVLGLPFVEKDDSVDEGMIYKNIRAVPNSKLRNAMGVDVKLRVKHVVIGNHEGISWIGTVKTFEEVDALKQKFNAMLVIDGNPLPEAREFPKKYPGDAFCCFYHRDRERKEVIKWGTGDNYGHVQVDRTNIIQQTIDDLVKSKLLFTTDGMSKEAYIKSVLPEYVQHWKNIYRKTEEDSFGIPHSTWEKTKNRDDDFVHATIYFKIALSRVPKPSAHIDHPFFDFSSGTLPSFAPEILDGTMASERIPIFPQEDQGDWRSIT